MSFVTGGYSNAPCNERHFFFQLVKVNWSDAGKGSYRLPGKVCGMLALVNARVLGSLQYLLFLVQFSQSDVFLNGKSEK